MPADSLARWLDHAPAAYAVIRGGDHTLVYANAAFEALAHAPPRPCTGQPLAGALGAHAAHALGNIVDDVAATGTCVRDRRIELSEGQQITWSCAAWPVGARDGTVHEVVVELCTSTADADALAIQRTLAERMLLSALRDRDAVDASEASRARATFLAVVARRLASSLDHETTLRTIAGLSLPHLGAWCIVDVIGPDGAMRRVAVLHPDAGTERELHAVANRWLPRDDDPFGIPAARRVASPSVLTEVDAALVDASRDPELLRTLLRVGIGPMLTIPLVIRDELVGAITFVAGRKDHVYTAADLELAEDLTVRSAMALDSARLHREATQLRIKAEAADQAKGAFLGAMSHELRTPLNAIGGYVDLIDLGLRGPVTDAQRVDLARIRRNQQHLTGLVTDILNLVRVGSGGLRYDIHDVSVHELLVGAAAMVEPLITAKQLVLRPIAGDDAIVARADPERLMQILVNLFSNAIKFTAPGGEIAVSWVEGGDHVLIHVSDTGIGIPPELLDDIFEPFVQVRPGLAGRESGAGLGLAISRDLARGMGGDLTVESEVGVGTTLTVRLARAEDPPPEV